MCIGHHGHPLRLRPRGAALEFLSNSRSRRNALLTGTLNLAQTSQLSYFGKIMLFFSSATSNI